MGRGGSGRRVAVGLLLSILFSVVGAVLVSPQAAPAVDGLVQGMAFQSNASPTEYERVAATGANIAYLDVWWQADSYDSNSVHRVPGTTPDSVLIADIRKAQAVGLRVVLMPKIYCNDSQNCRYGWRGDLQPSDPHAFLTSYGDMVQYYARLAKDTGVWLLFLGSEMNHVQTYRADWITIRDRVRETGFSGLVTYQPNWDQIDDVSFWDALDVVTVSAYFPLTTKESPDVATIKKAWHSSQVDPWKGTDWFGKLQGLANSTGKGVLIGEVGYRSSTTATAHPWYEWDNTSTPDQATQANAYQALLETFSNQPWWLGVIWWQWRGTDADTGNTDMSPKGKQAEQLLTRWWAQGWRPVPGTAGGGAGGTAPAPGANAATRVAASTKTNGTAATAPTPTSAAATQTGTAATAGAGDALAAVGSSSESGSPSSVVKLARNPDRRYAPVAIAVVALFAMAAALMSFGLRRVRLPRSAIA